VSEKKKVVLISYLEKIQGEVFENRRLIDNVEVSKSKRYHE